VPPKEPAKPGECVDNNDQCKEWSFFGECDKNPGYMLVSCKKSCKVCDPAKTNTGVTIDVPVKQAAQADKTATT